MTPSKSTASASASSRSIPQKPTNPRCQRERELGLAAKQRLIELLNEGELTVVVVGYDRKWKRPLAYVYAGEVDIGETLLREGHALHWTPGPISKAARMAVWCPSLRETP